MRTIAVMNQKGGVGKTTIALHLAGAFSHAGELVVLLDLDPQASATQWADTRPKDLPQMLVQSIQAVRLPKVAEAARQQDTGILIIDTPPRLEDMAGAIKTADLILVPCQASILDLRAMDRAIDLLPPSKPAFVVLNAVAAIGSEADEAAEIITTNLQLPVCPVRLGHRVAYKRSLGEGRLAQETEPGGKAAGEIAQLHKWACAQLHIRARAQGAMSA